MRESQHRRSVTSKHADTRKVQHRNTLMDDLSRSMLYDKSSSSGSDNEIHLSSIEFNLKEAE